MAFWYGWYGPPPGLRHWRAAPGEPGFASTDTPVLGAYDSHSADVIDQHLAWARAAGIDVLISSWWGPGTYEDESLRLLLDRIEATASPVRAAVYLETWALFSGGNFSPKFFTDPNNFTPAGRARARARAVSWISYLLETYGARPGVFRAAKDAKTAPVIFVYTAALFDPFEWQNIFRRVRAATGIDAFYDADVEGADVQLQGRVFDGLHLYNPAPLTLEGDLSLAARVVNRRAAVRDPAAPVADPITVGADYRAWAAEARALGRSWSATVIPGFDDRKIRNPSFVVSRDHGDGRTYDAFWRIALQSRPDWVLITSFNEWHEGTEIEQSREYGDEFLTRTLTWAKRIRLCA